MSLGWCCIVSSPPQRASKFILRYENKFGRDMSDALPRCLYAAKFISANDPTGEIALTHWISVGQLQDLKTPIDLQP